MIKAFRGCLPVADATARAAENTTIIGKVTLEKESSVWYGAVLRGDIESIRIGARSNVQDNCVLHCSDGCPITLGEGTTVGHGAILHGCTVGDHCLIGMGATILNGAVIGDYCVVGAGALVTERKVFPPHSLIIGVPAKAVRTYEGEDAQRSAEDIRRNADAYCREAEEQLPTVK